jgi:thymidine kinase
MKSKIKVYDAIMGSGKTHNAIERMKGYLKEGKKFIYVTPFLSEIERIEEKLNSDEVYSPKNLGEPDFNGFEYEEVLIDENGKIDLKR